MAAEDYHRTAREKYDSEEAARVYSTRRVGRRKDRIETKRIVQALTGVPRGALVLDLPCGTGRMTTHLVGLGYKVVAADYSEHMVVRARQKCMADLGKDEASLGEVVRFGQQDVMKTTFEDGAFDAVVCNRLLHHFGDAELRRGALRELSRVCKGPVVVSFYCSMSLSALRSRIVNAVRGVTPARRPIAFAEFRDDLAAAGLAVEEVYPVRFLVSPQTIVKAVKARSAALK